MHLHKIRLLSPTYFRVMLAAALVVLLGTAFQPSSAQSGVVWTAQYYNNPYLEGDPALTRQDTSIQFNWGTAAPWPEVNSDNFSVRWASDPYFAAGTYRFYVSADDNVALRVDFPFNPQIDTFATPAVGQTLTVDIALEAGVHHIQVDYREVTDNAFVYVNWANMATNPTGPSFPIPQTPIPVGGSWTAQYYTNAGLIGSPALILPETVPSHNWGAGSPDASIPADNFSARWTSIQTLNAGNYLISVHADDGVRVYVDGTSYIDEWHSAINVIYTATINLAAGQHNIQIDYYETSGLAFLDFNLSLTTAITQPMATPIAQTTGEVVTAVRLNVRSEPSATGNILLKINKNETYPVIGKNGDSSWWQINVNGTLGWVYWRFFDVSNPQRVPVVTTSTGPSLDQPPVTGYGASTLVTVNVRSAPGTSNAILGQVARGNLLPVVGRNATNTWWQVNYGEITGWINARFAPLQSTAILANIPVTG